MSSRSSNAPLILVAMLMGLVLGVMLAPKLDRSYWNRQTSTQLVGNRINSVMDIVDHYYVDPVNYDSVTDIMMNSFLSALDPHSHYMPPREAEKEMELMRGNFEGIGVVLFFYGDTVYAGEVMQDSPAERAGVRTGDRIMRVDTTRVSGAGMCANSSAVVDLIRGPRHSMVTIWVQRHGSRQLVPIKIRRDVIARASVPAAFMLDRRTGYVFISHFAETTGQEFHNAVARLANQGMQHLVVDLRGNGGGVLQSAIDIADELLPQGDLIVYTQGEHSRRQNIYATRGGLFEQGQLTLLIDEFSASASEVLAGAIQDNDRGRITGRRSFGKGLVQRQFPLPGDASMMLTIARYHSPSGRCIQRPYDKGTDEYYTDYLMQLIDGDSALMASTADTVTFRTKQGRKVYGGGGILPDLVLPHTRDTNLIYYNRLISENVMEEVMHDQLWLHYDELKARYPDFEQFAAGFRVTDADWQRILARADRKGIARHAGSIARYGAEMRNRYKALIAQALYGGDSYYRIAMPSDNELQTVVGTSAGSRP